MNECKQKHLFFTLLKIMYKGLDSLRYKGKNTGVTGDRK